MRRATRLLRNLGIGALALASVTVVGCVRFSGGTWAIRSAGTPEGWPALTPVGTVEVKEYPTHRAAVADADDMDGMFMELFRHIQRNDVAMTAPVEMEYDRTADGAPRMTSMAFLYRSRQVGRTGEDGTVRVLDHESKTFASVGVRGDYTTEHFEKGLDQLGTWLRSNSDAWEAIGPPRYLGYNGPFVPRFMRYGEVQIPLEPRADRWADRETGTVPSS